jgi:mRNA-degrading endonuclease HigB of HigAB toxin-antitoxin module
MKFVREYINEKFEEDSDPIKDLDIGYKEEFNTRKNIDSADRIMKKNIRETQKKYEQKLREKLINKFIIGNFYTETYNLVSNRTKKIKDIQLTFNFMYLQEIIIINDKGKKYRLINNENYTLKL